MHARQLHKTSSQFFITVLNTSKLAFLYGIAKNSRFFDQRR